MSFLGFQVFAFFATKVSMYYVVRTVDVWNPNIQKPNSAEIWIKGNSVFSTELGRLIFYNGLA